MKTIGVWRFLPVLIAAVLWGTGPADISKVTIDGHWTGAIDLPSMKLEVDIDFTLQADGSWKGDISIPMQNARDLPLEKIGLQGKEATFAISGIPGDPIFKGVLSEDGKEIKGTFTQGGQAFPFTLKSGQDPVAAAQVALKDLDSIVTRGLEGLTVPGAAIAVVRNGQVVLAKGYGYRDLEKKTPVTADTLMAIGSSSKAFTTFTLAVLADQGKFEWDTPLRRYIPWFKLYDPAASERLTPRDLVTHRSGLPRHDLLWYNNQQINREELVRRLAFLEPTADLRTRFQYNNLMFLTAGYLAEVLTGKSWEEAVRANVFEPLGMKRSNFSVAESQKDGDFAWPYREKEKKSERIPFRDINIIGPAGSINSSAREMSRWLLVHLNGGKIDGQPVIQPQTLGDLHNLHMPMGSTPVDPMILPVGYGMGWMIDVYRGYRRIHHGGNIDGFSALVSFIPQEGIGIVVLTNANATALTELLVRHIADLLLDLKPRDWIAEAIREREMGRQAGQEAEARGKARRLLKTKPSHPIEEYAGVYNHAGYGDLQVIFKDKKLHFVYNGITTPLEHWHYETWNGLPGTDPTFTDFKLTFGADLDGRIAWLEAAIEPTLDLIRFTKKADARFFDPKYLRGLTGRYQLVNQIVTISLKGDALTAAIPGQPEYIMEPRLGDEFVFKQVRIVTIRFLVGADGRATTLELNQGGAIFEAKRVE